MVKRDGAETRKERISQIARDLQVAFYEKKVREEPEEITLSRLVGLEMFNTGLTKAKTIEYLEILQVRGQCELDFENDLIKRPQL